MSWGPGAQGSGKPEVQRLSVETTAAYQHDFNTQTCFLALRATSYPVKVYFSKADAIGDTNYILVPVAAAATPNGEWQGPLRVRAIWALAVGGTATLEVVAALIS